MKGKFVISLDFELMWGVRDKRTVDDYGQNISGVHLLIPKLIKLFNKYDVSATFASVGFLLLNSKKNLEFNFPKILPKYVEKKLNPYSFDYLNSEKFDEKMHFALDLIDQIKLSKKLEIGSHTFSHYYCLEKGQDLSSFNSDLEKYFEISNFHNIKIESIVFPRNQMNEKYIESCYNSGIKSYRGNQRSWIYESIKDSEESIFRRLLRFIDSYINLTGHHTYSEEFIKSFKPFNIQASRFLRPWSSVLFFIEFLKIRRIKNSMTYAAKNNKVYHLWWHPHNYGLNQKQNLLQLEIILKHYSFLNKQYSFESYNMISLTNHLNNEKT